VLGDDGVSDLESLRAFETAATRGSFAAAGRALGLSRNKVSKLVLALEYRLGKPLFERTTRAVTLTQAGANYLERVRRALDELDAADRAVREPDATPMGKLTIHAPLTFGTVVLSRCCASFRQAFPSVDVELSLDDALVEPAPGPSDVVIRVADRFTGTAAVTRLGTVSRALYASPDYLERRGAPATPDELVQHDCVGYANLASGSRWVLERDDQVRRVPIRSAFACNVGLGVLEAIMAGVGIGLLPEFLAAAPRRGGAIIPVLSDWRAPDLSIYALTQPTMRNAPKVRAYIDFLQGALR
jgi:DNA-binding transcriptional LysR family regulator